MNTGNRLIVHIRPISELTAYANNARAHTEKQVKQLARSIETFGFNCPVLVDARDNLIAGHGRVLAAQQVGWTEVPTIALEHLTPAQVQAYRIADNRLTDLSVWNDRLLAEELQQLQAAELDFDLTTIGFELPEIDLRIQSLSLGDDEEPIPDPDDTTLATSRLGDVWVLGAHKIICADALGPQTYVRLLGKDKADLVIADLPFNRSITKDLSHNGRVQHGEFPMASGEMSPAEFTQFLTRVMGLMRGASVQGALLYQFMDWRGMGEILAAGQANNLELKNLVVWNKGCGGMGSFYRSQHELVFVFKADTGKHTNNIQLGRFGRNRTNVWDYPGANSFGRTSSEGNLLALHPTVKPVPLIADAILDACERGDSVLDPFLGSGTTVIAAEQTGRKGYGIELDPRYVDIAVRRWQRLTDLQATHADTGQTFDVVAFERSRAVILDPALESVHEPQ
jgi:DNA modification methylase